MKKQRKELANCGPHAPSRVRASTVVGDEAFLRAAALFRAAGDEHRLRLIELLGRGEQCVTELAEAVGAKLSTLSQQLKVLRGERIVKQRREGKHIFYSLADEHVRELVRAALDHASEHPHSTTPHRKEKRP
jgi:ArsR family transcriptional regulator, lead/cadmium/zinc/bismuth-responsive transcriptional repressor